MRLTLDDVLGQPDWGLEACNGGEQAATVAVEGAHSIDLPDPVPWLQERWIMLTTGVQLRGNAAAQRRLVAELADGGIAALGLGLGIALERVPKALLAEAAARDFPLFTVPLETPFREIVSFVNRSAVSSDLQALRRLSSMQRYLLDAVHQTVPEQALVERVASLLDKAEVAYLAPDGTPFATTAPGPAWCAAALRQADANLREFEYEGRWGVIAPVLEGDAPAGWLAALLASATVTRHVARPVVRTAGELLGLVSVTRLAALRERRERRGRLGARLLRVIAGETDEGLPAALAAEGIDFTRPCRAAILAVGGGEMSGALEAALDAGGHDHAVATVGGETIIIAQDDLAGLGARLEADPRLAAVRAGISEPFARLEGAASAIDQARLALTVTLATPGAPAVQAHEGLEPSVALLGPRSAGPLRERLVGALAPLEEEPRLRAAVVAYLDAELDVGRAALALGLHRNSVRYRLDRAELLLGRNLRSPGTVATIHLALLAERLTTVGRP